MPHTATHTYAKLAVSQETFHEIWSKLCPSYGHLLREDPQEIILGEIALVPDDEGDVTALGRGMEARMDGRSGAVTSDSLSRRLWVETFLANINRNKRDPKECADAALKAYKEAFP